ncbi:unnamed protein product [Protopolystoma xenopodis]|uniref:Myosin motor domain-containing protein n=1 Tax=Protopolystoma xenopodis TaxID=117903 RepID=A0A3S5FCD8_9PLAT|nr:unnamed protein product [Protopolystoma xenopodis]
MMVTPTTIFSYLFVLVLSLHAPQFSYQPRHNYDLITIKMIIAITRRLWLRMLNNRYSIKKLQVASGNFGAEEREQLHDLYERESKYSSESFEFPIDDLASHSELSNGRPSNQANTNFVSNYQDEVSISLQALATVILPKLLPEEQPCFLDIVSSQFPSPIVPFTTPSSQRKQQIPNDPFSATAPDYSNLSSNDETSFKPSLKLFGSWNGTDNSSEAPAATSTSNKLTDCSLLSSSSTLVTLPNNAFNRVFTDPLLMQALRASLTEAVCIASPEVMCAKMLQLYTCLQFWKAIVIFGPASTGKTR